VASELDAGEIVVMVGFLLAATGAVLAFWRLQRLHAAQAAASDASRGG
jgi:uncharacterized membrane protein